MLQTLIIQNVVLIDKLTLNFDDKLNTISGETGAGKSIMLDSLSFVFGGRSDKTLIRSGETKMKVEAVFNRVSSSQAKYIKEQFNINCDDELFLSRELDVNGKNVCLINGEQVPVAVVKKICSMLVDIHGQSEHLAILDNAYQLSIVDLFDKKSADLLAELNAEIENYKATQKEIKDLGGNEKEKQNLIDLYTYQIDEINNAGLAPNEFEDLTLEKKEMQQFEKINENLQIVLAGIKSSGYDAGTLEKLGDGKRALAQIENLNDEYKNLKERLEGVSIELSDIVDTIQDKLDNNNFNQDRFNEIDSRLDFLKTLYRKYGDGYEQVINYYDEISKKLNNLLNSTEIYNKLIEKSEKILEKINFIQNNLTIVRKNSAEILKIKLEKELKILGMPNAKFDIYFSKIGEEFSTFGQDYVEFMFSSNLGVELKPLNKVVSGGEMSRVMLAYKIVVATIDEIHTIVFDEVDSGLSGNIAMVVAEYMARLSQNKQILAVSHLPQICAMADKNIKVEKYSDNTSTHTRAKDLTGEELLKEIARLMGAGEDEHSITASGDLKARCNEYKSQLLSV